MSDRTTPESVICRAENLIHGLGPALGRFDKWSGWEHQLRQIIADAPMRPEVAISLVGGTGAGKSTLVNALLEARVLPVGNMKACTAAISEVSYSEGRAYRAEIEFVPRSAWQHEVQALIGDLKDVSDTQILPPEEIRADGEPVFMATTARDKLWTIYGTQGGNAAHLDINHLTEPAEIKAALDRGIESIASPDLEDFRKRVSQYLDSEHRFWPIVKTVKLRGPFAALECGAKLIDLPGLNDPNEAREEITREYLKTSRYVWIVFELRRALKKDVAAVIQSPDFIRQIVMDGRANALTLVGTCSDDFDYDVAIERYGLPDTSTEAAVAEYRNREAVEVVRQQLDDIASEMASKAETNGDSLRTLQEQFRDSKVFTTSAKEYLRLHKLYKGKNAILDTPDQTQLPALRCHLIDISSAFGVEAKARAQHRQLGILFQEMEREVASRKLTLKRAVETSESQRKDTISAAQAAQRFLGERLKDVRENFDDSIKDSRKQFDEALTRAIREAELEVVRVKARWECMYWSTIRAVARRNGAFHGSTGNHDFPGDIADPILRKITFAWADFFGKNLSGVLERTTKKLGNVADDHRRELLDILQKISTDKESRTSLDKIGETTASVLNELLQQSQESMKDKIDRVRRRLYETIPAQVRANMSSAFEKAAEERGRGMKGRMIDSISRHAQEVAKTMFEDARKAVLDGVGGLLDALSKNQREMSDAVERQSGLMAENVTKVSPGLGPHEIAVIECNIRAAEAALISVAEVAVALRAQA